MVINDDDSRMFRPVAIMIVGKAKIRASGKNLYGLRFEVINSPPAANNSLKRNPLLLIYSPVYTINVFIDQTE